MASRICTLAILSLVLTMLVLSDAFPRPPRRPVSAHIPEGPLDQLPAATHHGHHGRVQIKVYRGPDQHHFAPHGYWVKQPADDGPHH